MERADTNSCPIDGRASRWPRCRLGDATHRAGRTSRGSRDAGFGLPETLVAMVVTGLLMAALGMSMVVVLRQHDNSTGRMANASSEQAVGALLPADLASSEDVNPAPAARPCPVGKCPVGFALDGSNALMASWSDVVDPGPPVVTKETRVSWRYRSVGSEYQIVRAECVEASPRWSCTQRVVLHDAPPPPSDTTFTPGTTSPTWAMKVVNPLAASDGSYDPTGNLPGLDEVRDADQMKGARRVIVMMDGGGDGGGSAGGSTAVSLTAGSTIRKDELNPDVLPPPTFGELKSRCGGNFGLLIDTSHSIGGNITKIRTGLEKLKEVFAGTPIKIQLVDFDKIAWVIDDGNKVLTNRWYDMLNSSDVEKLQLGIDQLASFDSAGGTNYEEGFFRSFRLDNGQQQPVLPDTLLFFTDGEVYGSRRVATHGSAPLFEPPVDTQYLPSNKVDQLNRALYWANLYRKEGTNGKPTRMIGVGVGIVTRDQSFRIAIAQLVAGNQTGIPALLSADGSTYVNADVANVYMTPDWDMFSSAVESVALGMCGGTVTLQTVDQSDNPLGSAVSYRNTAVVDAAGDVVDPNAGTLETSPQYPSATFDFSIPGGDYVNVTLEPSDLSQLGMLAPVGWSCKVRGVNRAVTTAPIPGSVWSSVTVKVRANDPVSCRLKVRPA